MDKAHERFETLAVGHVLGGLIAADAADFRSHLLGCRDCRLRVAELRDIAADLAAAEREERADARVRTEVARRTAAADDDADDDLGEGRRDGLGPSARHIGLGALAVVALIGVLAFWTLHLRAQVAVTTAAAERLEDTVIGLADGVAVATELSEGVRGTVVVDGEQVAFSLVALPEAASSERIVVWLVGTSDGDESVLYAQGGGVASGAIADDGARELVVTVEDVGGEVTEPGPRVLVRADLDRPADAG